MPKKKKPATRDEAKQISRDALVEAAKSLFAEQGLDRPSLDAICERAGYTRGAFYVHFEDRDALVVAVMERVGAEFLASLFSDLEPAAPGAPAGKRFVHASRRFVEAIDRGDYPLMGKPGGPPMIRPHQLLAACARSPRVREHYSALVQASIFAVRGLLEEDQRDGGVRADVGPDGLSLFVHALVVGAQTMSELGVVVDPGALSAIFEKLVTPPPTSRGARASP